MRTIVLKVCGARYHLAARKRRLSDPRDLESLLTTMYREDWRVKLRRGPAVEHVQCSGFVRNRLDHSKKCL